MSPVKRTQAGRRLEHRCWVSLSPDEPLSECYLLDISATGAKINWRAVKPNLTEFNLYLTPDGHVGRKCKVIWQTETEVGLKFLSKTVPPRNIPAADDHETVVV